MKKTILYDLHTKLNGKMVPFAGYLMPVQYPQGVMHEHNHTRQHAGLFDVSHMGQIMIRPKTGDISNAALDLERLIPIDILGLGVNRQRYGFFTTQQGGILDDLMIANYGDCFFLVVNAACKEADISHMEKHLTECEIEIITDRALIALQGPHSDTALAKVLSSRVKNMRFMDVITHDYKESNCWISRSGYTGEDGYEISISEKYASDFMGDLLAQDTVQPIGLGARDSLRLEAGLCLYGNDIDTTTTPIEAQLKWAIQKTRRADGARAGGFLGSDIILEQLENNPKHYRVGFRPDGRAPMRAGTILYADETSEDKIGWITSGGFGPSVKHPISMGYINHEFKAENTKVFAQIRGKRLPAFVSALPFIPSRFKR